MILRLFSQDLQQILFFTKMSGTLIWVCLEICVVHNTPGKSTLVVETFFFRVVKKLFLQIIQKFRQII